MKRVLLFSICLIATSTLISQVIFSGISPESIQGNYPITYGEVTSGWGGPDLLIPANRVQDTLVLYDDQDNLGCNFARNDAEIDGHIAILYRGECEFGLKAANAEAAGAIACVIINNIPGDPVGMAPGASGSNINIPVVMVSDAVGARLIAAMQNDPVVVFIGNKNGFYQNDIGTAKGTIIRPRYSSIPVDLANGSEPFVVELGANVHNAGSNNQTNVTLQAIVTLDGEEIYNETSSPEDLTSGESSFIELPVLDPSSWKVGYYTLDYIVSSDSVDQYDFDNHEESNFVISETDFSYAYIEPETLLPHVSNHNRVIDGSTGNPIPYYSSCIHFRDQNASRLTPKSITFSATKSNDAIDPSIEGEPFLIQVFNYNDYFETIEDASYQNPISSFSEFMSQEFYMEGDYQDTLITAHFDDNIMEALEDDQRYMFCVTTFNAFVYLGTDSKRDYTVNEERYLQPLFPIEANSGSFNPNGFGPDIAPSISVTFKQSTAGLNQEQLALDIKTYPSPTTDIINLDFKNYNVDKIELMNTLGQTVVSKSVQPNATKETLNVEHIENGMYLVKFHLANQNVYTTKIIVKH